MLSIHFLEFDFARALRGYYFGAILRTCPGEKIVPPLGHFGQNPRFFEATYSFSCVSVANGGGVPGSGGGGPPCATITVPDSDPYVGTGTGLLGTGTGFFKPVSQSALPIKKKL